MIQIEDEICQATVNDCFMSAGDNVASSSALEKQDSPSQNVKEMVKSHRDLFIKVTYKDGFLTFESQ